MKKTLSFIMLAAFAFEANAQQILCQDFANNTPGWNTSNGASISTYPNPDNNCVTEYGIITPGVGGNNPAKILSEIVVPNQQLLEVKFNIYRFDANLSCASRSNFGCPTSVDILAVESTYNGTDPVGDNAVIYSNNTGFLLPAAGGQVTLIITLPPSLPSLKLFFNFSTVSNCTQGGTKYVLDKFCFTGYQPCSIANTCPPVANNDLFISGAQGFANSALLGNVYGTNLAYTPYGTHAAYTTRSLTAYPAQAPDGGKDYDIDNHPLTGMTFTLNTQSFTAADAIFTFNSDGTFYFQRLNPNKVQFFFTYTITDPTALSDPGGVRIDYTSGSPLPVKLNNFNAIKTGVDALLKWETAQEMNNKGFEIQRKTTGGFETIGFVDSKAPGGYSTNTIAYSYRDLDMPTDPNVFYRLAQVDIDGKKFLSDIKVISNSDTKQPLLVYPNPSRGDLRVVIPSDITGTTDVRIFDPAGAAIKTISNTSEKNIHINGLQPGIYIVKVFTKLDGIIYSGKLIVQ
jgi:Secretion system C-terminal sorting domain